MWIQTVDRKNRKKHYYYIKYFYSNGGDRYRIWTSNSNKLKLNLWVNSRDLEGIERIFGEEIVVGTY